MTDMEWVETTAKSVEEAKDIALDELGVSADEAEFEILEEPKAGLFGRVRGEARVRARVKPSPVRPKIDRRNRGRGRRAESAAESTEHPPTSEAPKPRDPAGSDRSRSGKQRQRGSGEGAPQKKSSGSASASRKDTNMDDQGTNGEPVDVEAVGAAAVTFMTGLVEAFGANGTATAAIDGTEIDVAVVGSELGLLVGHGGRTLSAVQDLARVAAQRRLGDHETRLRIDVAGYRAKRRVALERFATTVADEVIASGRPKALEPMQSADRKIVHDVLSGVEGVTSSSEGDDPMRRVVISPA
ncbi:MAG: RNA-binding cell elongation regulator Jag/EloR [Ilumatobacteraceae bacterium]